ncbi:expressed unknown protein [Seminavis robusta]|uniref:Uncharacterized protein n=1 Tax=Seminavis robusta TaxID=568900 RepID=A0A9N8E963_9STRA|nr:expressed unknown protein [Seminavis robusta]|eukprot:Sro687_g187260.1 n/a (183) ;mRNA; r:32719-33267
MDIKRTGDSHLFSFYHLDLSIDEETKPKPSPATTRAMASLLSNLDMLVEVCDEDCTFLWRFKKNQYLTVEQGRKVGTHLSEKVADKDSRLVSFGFSPLSGRELVMKTDRGIEIVFILPAGQGRFVEPTGPGADPGAEVVVVAEPCLTPVEVAPVKPPAALKKPPPMSIAVKPVPAAVVPVKK